MNVIRRHRGLQALILFGPAAAWALAFVIVPTAFAILMSVWKFENFQLVTDWNLDSYKAFFDESIFHDPLWTSIKYGVAVAVISVGLSFPLAHYIHFRAKRKMLMFGAVVIALWLGYLLRIFGWRILLGQEGVFNTLLMDVGLIDKPLGFLLYSPFAVIVSQTHLAMPFAFIPIYASIERLPKGIMQAASDLGANGFRRVMSVEIPIIADGLTFGALFAFVLAFGDYFAPSLVGSPSTVAIGSVAGEQFGGALDWPQGAAIGVIMLVAVLVVLVIPQMIKRLRMVFVHFRDKRDERLTRMGK